MSHSKQVVSHLLEDEDDNLDWTPDPADVDAPADLKKSAHDLTSADWRWQAVHELRLHGRDPDIELPDLESDEPENVDSIEVEIAGVAYYVYKNDDAAEAAAIEQVTASLEDDPTSFNKDWLSNFINEKRLRDELWSDYREHSLEQQYESDEDWRDHLIEKGHLEQEDFFGEDGDEFPIDQHLLDKIEDARDEWIDRQENDFDPMGYLEDIYGEEQATEVAIRIAGLNVAQAAESAVSSDGWQHFLSLYDNQSYELPSGAVYFRA